MDSPSCPSRAAPGGCSRGSVLERPVSLLAEAGRCLRDSAPEQEAPQPGVDQFPFSQNPAVFRVVWKAGLGRPGHLRAGSVDDLAAGDVGTSVVRTWIGCLCGVPCLSRVHDAVLGRCPGLLLLGLCPGCYRCPDPCLPPSLPIPTFTSLPFWFLLSLPASKPLGPQGQVGSLS